MNICGNSIKIRGRLIRIGNVESEGYRFLENPDGVLSELKESRHGIDLFTFMQRLPHTNPQYSYPMELDNLAALPISTFEHWWAKQIDGKTRNIVRRSEKNGITVREVEFNEDLVRGIWEIYNECPVRQGRPFPHYGKDLETVRKMSATFMESSVFIGAFLEEKLIGFVKLTMDDAHSQAAIMHILGMMRFRDKAPVNALIAQCVRSCEKRGIPYLVYSKFAYGKKKPDSLADFKVNNGFQRMDLPRYFVPLTFVGRLALRLRLQHNFRDRLPESAVARLRDLRSSWLHRSKQPTT